MAKGNFLLNNVHKKLGDMVFQRRNGEQIIRARAKSIRNPQTEAQARQRSRMNEVVQVYRLFAGVIYKRIRRNWSHFNGFTSENLKAMRPEQQAGIAFNYLTDFDKMIPPTPREGEGNGTPLFAPYIITKGTINIPPYIVSNSSTGLWGSALFGMNYLNMTPAGGSTSINPYVMIKIPSLDAINQELVNMGILSPAPTTYNQSAACRVEYFMKALAKVTTGSYNTQFGLLIAYAKDNHTVMTVANYNELGDFVKGTIQRNSFVGGVIGGFSTLQQPENSRGEQFMISSMGAGLIPSLGAAISIRFNSMTANYGQPTACCLIASEREPNGLKVSTSRLILDNEAKYSYETRFDPELIEKGITDFQRVQNQDDSLNLELI